MTQIDCIWICSAGLLTVACAQVGQVMLVMPHRWGLSLLWLMSLACKTGIQSLWSSAPERCLAVNDGIKSSSHEIVVMQHGPDGCQEWHCGGRHCRIGRFMVRLSMFYVSTPIDNVQRAPCADPSCSDGYLFRCRTMFLLASLYVEMKARSIKNGTHTSLFVSCIDMLICVQSDMKIKVAESGHAINDSEKSCPTRQSSVLMMGISLHHLSCTQESTLRSFFIPPLLCRHLV